MAALPFKKADEPLAAIVAVNAVIAKRGDAVLAAFKAALKHTAGPEAGADGAASPTDAAATNGRAAMDVGTPAGDAAAVAAAAAQVNGGASSGAVPAELAAACEASLAVSMLLLLKSFLLSAYGLASERVALFATASADKRKQVHCNLALHVSNCECGQW